MIARLATLLALVAGAVLLATAQSSAAPERAKDATAGSATPQATAAKRRRRPGCGKFCRQAGGFGAGPDDEMPVKIKRQTVRVNANSIIAIRARCRLSSRCNGAIIVQGHVEYGRANLRIPAKATRRVRVFVTRAGRRYLDEHGADSTGFATVPLKDKDQPVSVSGDLTLLPQR